MASTFDPDGFRTSANCYRCGKRDQLEVVAVHGDTVRVCPDCADVLRRSRYGGNL